MLTSVFSVAGPGLAVSGLFITVQGGAQDLSSRCVGMIHLFIIQRWNYLFIYLRFFSPGGKAKRAAHTWLAVSKDCLSRLTTLNRRLNNYRAVATLQEGERTHTNTLRSLD